MNKIDDIRKIRDMSYQDIAEKSRVTSAYVCMLAKNKRQNPSLDVMQRIANALEAKVERVFRVNQEIEKWGENAR